MDDVKREEQRQVDEEILVYVREMQQLAPVTADSIIKYLVVTRRRKVTELSVQDRLNYLASANLLKCDETWQGGSVKTYTITADGQDTLDGNIPPRNWKR